MATKATLERAQEAEELLHAAEVDLAAGREQPGALKAWDAAVIAVKAVAEPRGWGCDGWGEINDAVKKLEKESGVKGLTSGLGTADALRTQGEYGLMYEGDGVEVDFPRVQQFVAQMLDLAAPDRPKKVVPEKARLARELMENVHYDFGDGKGEKGSENMWQAVSGALQAVAEERRWRCGTVAEMREVAAALARETGDCRFVGGFAVAETYFANFAPEFFSDEHDDYARPLVRRFVIRVLHRLS